MKPSVVDALVCPACGLEFVEPAPGDNALRCVEGHSFDIARQGYVNLLTGHGTKFKEDTAAMVAARDRFLDAGHYRGLADALADTVAALPGFAAPRTARPLLLDAGTGTGWYLQQLLAALGNGGRGPDPAGVDAIGLDISKFALRRAARRNPEAANLVWDIWRPLPVAVGRADVVLVVFAPRNPAEFARVLRPDGRLVVVTPRPGHLAEIAGPAGLLGIQPEKDAALVQALVGAFEPAGRQDVTLPLSLDRRDVANVALMGPAGHHLEPEALERAVAALPETTGATAQFTISTFRPRR